MGARKEVEEGWWTGRFDPHWFHRSYLCPDAKTEDITTIFTCKLQCDTGRPVVQRDSMKQSNLNAKVFMLFMKVSR